MDRPRVKPHDAGGPRHGPCRVAERGEPGGAAVDIVTADRRPDPAPVRRRTRDDEHTGHGRLHRPMLEGVQRRQAERPKPWARIHQHVGDQRNSDLMRDEPRPKRAPLGCSCLALEPKTALRPGHRPAATSDQTLERDASDAFRIRVTGPEVDGQDRRHRQPGLQRHGAAPTEFHAADHGLGHARLGCKILLALASRQSDTANAPPETEDGRVRECLRFLVLHPARMIVRPHPGRIC
jgi:hypothetical protein